VTDHMPLVQPLPHSSPPAGPLAELRVVEIFNTIADICQDPHYAARDMIVKLPHPQLGHTLQVVVVPKFSRTPRHIHHTGPDVGSDTRQVLLNRGFDEQQISALRAGGIVMEAKISL